MSRRHVQLSSSYVRPPKVRSSAQLNTLFRSSNLSAIYNKSMVLRLRPAPPSQGAHNNGTAVEVLMQLRQSPPHAVSTVTTNFIQGMHNARRHLWLGNFTVKLDHILFTGESQAKLLRDDEFSSKFHGDYLTQTLCLIFLFETVTITSQFTSIERKQTTQNRGTQATVRLVQYVCQFKDKFLEKCY